VLAPARFEIQTEDPMATRAEQAKSAAALQNSARKRAAAPKPHPTKPQMAKATTAASPKGRALHGRTKLQADAKAGKPDPGRITGFFKTGPHGGEAQTFNDVPGTGRGSDGAASVKKASRKSSRGSVAGGEKVNTQGHAAHNALSTPEKRSARAAAKAKGKGAAKSR